MNLSKCAAYYVLRRFPGVKIPLHNSNLTFSKRVLSVRNYASQNDVTKSGESIQNTGETDAFKQLEVIQRSAKNKRALLEEIWSNNRDLSSAFIGAYLRTCVDYAHVDHRLDSAVFLERANGDAELLRLLLKYTCYKGHVQDIVKVLAAMKDAGIPADESVFNMIVLGHVVNDGVNGGELALKTMKAAKIPATENTQWSILKGLCRRGDKNEFTSALRDVSYLAFDEENFCEIVYLLGVYDNRSGMEDFLNFIGKESIPRTCQKNLQVICFGLIKEEKPEAAYLLYTHLEEAKSERRFGVDFLEEMVICETPIEKMLSITKDLITTEKNPLAMVDLTELILISDEKSEIWRVFSELDALKPHYFWPMFVHRGRKSGERGVFEILAKMYEYKTQPDYDTLSYYLLGFCDLGDVDGLMRRLGTFNEELTMRELFNPVLYQLLSKSRVDDAKKFCEKHNLPIFGERVLKQLTSIWGETKNSVAVVYILQRICETNPQSNDWTGKFLVKCMKFCQANENDDKALLNLIDLLRKSELKMSSLLADYAYTTLNGRFKNSNLRGEIEASLDKLLDVTKPDSVNTIQHPRDMNLEELECHYVELSNKNMETRGVLQRLINGYSRVNNFGRVQELREAFGQSGYAESPGMKAHLFQVFTQAGNLHEAGAILEDLKSTSPNFSLDSFKVINFAKLLTENGESERAMEILRNEKTEIKNTSNIEKNCWNLLNAAKTATDAKTFFDILLEKKYCTPSNIILGPLIRAHLKNDDLKAAVDDYVRYTQEYRRTPLQSELLQEVFKTKDEGLLNRVLNATANVHGIKATRLTIIAALAEKGMVKPLQKTLLENHKIDPSKFRVRCERWVTENKVLPLLTISDAVKRLKVKTIDVEFARICILRTYGAQNDYEAALAFWQELEVNNPEAITPRLKNELNGILRRCNVKGKFVN